MRAPGSVLAALFVLGCNREHATPTAAPAGSTDPSSACVLDGDLQGAWSAVDDPSRSVRLSRIDFASAHGPWLYSIQPVIACTRDGFDICSVRGRETVVVTRDGERMVLTFQGEGAAPPRTYARGSKASFDATPLALPPPIELPQQHVIEIARELEKREAADQRVRVASPIGSKEMDRVDADNEAWITALIGQIGWIDNDRFRQSWSDAAWLIVQHADNLPLLMAVTGALDRKNQGSKYALMYDRVQTRLGKPQRYGSQIVFDAKGKKGLFPLERPEQVDALRAEVRLEPLDEYLRGFGVTERVEIRCE